MILSNCNTVLHTYLERIAYKLMVTTRLCAYKQCAHRLAMMHMNGGERDYWINYTLGEEEDRLRHTSSHVNVQAGPHRSWVMPVVSGQHICLSKHTKLLLWVRRILTSVLGTPTMHQLLYVRLDIICSLDNDGWSTTLLKLIDEV